MFVEVKKAGTGRFTLGGGCCLQLARKFVASIVVGL